MFPKLSDEDMLKAEKHLTELDKWALNECNNVIMKCHKHYEIYDFHAPATDIRHLIWETFASHYIELVKNRAYNQNNEFTKEQQHGAIYTLHRIMDAILNMLAPILPLMTYRIYKELHGKDIHFEPNNAMQAYIPNEEKFKNMQHDLMSAHNIKHLSFGERSIEF